MTARAVVVSWLVAASGLTGAQAQVAQPPDTAVIAGIIVHGNHTTPDADVLETAGVAAGQPFTAATLADVRRRLEASGRFRSVQVRERYASFSDPSAVLLVLLVEERVGISVDVPSPGPLRRFGASTMWLPVLGYQDGYGFTYGARVSFVDLLGRSTRIAIPLTWGGERRASLAVERTFARGPLSRIEVSGGTWRREFPPTGQGERRDFAAVRFERAVGPWLRVAGRGGVAAVSLGGVKDHVDSAGVEAVVDTRRDPAFARNAVFASAAWEHLWFDGSRDTPRVTIDARGYVGLPWRTVLVAGVQHAWVADPVPSFELQLLGGSRTLRGFALGYRAGDCLTAGSVELRLPVTSPLRVGRFGFALFADRGAVYPAGTGPGDARYDTGAGAGLFATLPVLSFRLDVAHGVRAGTRAHVTFGARF